MLVTQLLVDTFPDVFNLEFTAGMEEARQVEEGKRSETPSCARALDPRRAISEVAKKTKEIKDKLQQPTGHRLPGVRPGS